ncbi:MAG: tetratricopeptide repeat protein [Dehalococcoidia bacterium]|nr:tetratricopeptide repeat protein [Dehalococcoidia bacterium]
MVFQEETTKAITKLAEGAINLAMLSKWADAVSANQYIIERFPQDVDSYNRLGKAFTELGRYGDARVAYRKALELEPSNIIAKKNLTRLSGLREEVREANAIRARLDPKIFIEETGKTTQTALSNVAGKDVLVKITAGDPVNLKVWDRNLVAETERGDYVGQVEPRLGIRILKLMESGNRYSGAITGIDGSIIRVIIKEVYQSPAMAGRLSFPSKAPDSGFRAYTKDSMVRYDLSDEDSLDDDDISDDWDESMPGMREEHDFEEAASDDEEDEV